MLARVVERGRFPFARDHLFWCGRCLRRPAIHARLAEGSEPELVTALRDRALAVDAADSATGAIAILIRMEGPAAADALRAIRDTPAGDRQGQAGLRELAAFGLRCRTDPVVELVPGLGHEVAAIRDAAATIIARRGDGEVFAEVVVYLESTEDWSARRAAATCLCLAGDGRGVRPLLDAALERESRPFVNGSTPYPDLIRPILVIGEQVLPSLRELAAADAPCASPIRSQPAVSPGPWPGPTARNSAFVGPMTSSVRLVVGS